MTTILFLHGWHSVLNRHMTQGVREGYNRTGRVGENT